METLIGFGVFFFLVLLFAAFSLGYTIGSNEATNKCNDILKDVDIKLSQLVYEVDHNEHRNS